MTEQQSFPIQEGIPMPVDVKSSKYPWADMKPSPDGGVTPGTSFPVYCPDKETCEVRRNAVHTSGVNYYTKRGIELKPHVRVVEENGVWLVRAWVKNLSEPDDE